MLSESGRTRSPEAVNAWIGAPFRRKRGLDTHNGTP